MSPPPAVAALAPIEKIPPRPPETDAPTPPRKPVPATAAELAVAAVPNDPRAPESIPPPAAMPLAIPAAAPVRPPAPMPRLIMMRFLIASATICEISCRNPFQTDCAKVLKLVNPDATKSPQALAMLSIPDTRMPAFSRPMSSAVIAASCSALAKPSAAVPVRSSPLPAAAADPPPPLSSPPMSSSAEFSRAAAAAPSSVSSAAPATASRRRAMLPSGLENAAAASFAVAIAALRVALSEFSRWPRSCVITALAPFNSVRKANLGHPQPRP
jgi:hypothetical protein